MMHTHQLLEGRGDLGHDLRVLQRVDELLQVHVAEADEVHGLEGFRGLLGFIKT